MSRRSSRVRMTNVQSNTPKYSGKWGLLGLETCRARNKVLCQYVKRRTRKSSLVWSWGSTLNDSNFLLAIDWWLGIPINGDKYKVPPDSRDIIISIFGQIEDWKTVGVTNMAKAFSASRNSKAATFNEDIGGDGLVNGKWDTTNVTTMENMFKGATSFNQNIMGWNTQLVENMSGMFNGATNFDNGGAPSNWLNLSNVTNMSSMFKNATTFNQNILGPGKWVTSAVTTMESMFEGANTFANGGTAVNVIALGRAHGAGGVSCKAMFKDCLWTLNIPDLSNDWISNITDMSSMFEGTTNFPAVGFTIGGWTPTQVPTMESMFKGAVNFNDNLSTWNVSNVTNMSSMFEGATSFQGTGNLDGWDLGNVTNTSSMFKNAASFIGTDIGANWDVAAVTNMSSMFEGATVFNEDLSTWDLLAITTESALENCFFGSGLAAQTWSNGASPASWFQKATVSFNPSQFYTDGASGQSPNVGVSQPVLTV